MPRLSAIVASVSALAFAAWVHVASASTGVVLMHGKGGSPRGLVAELARHLEGEGFAVANLEMPWSGKRGYDADVAAGVSEVEAAIAKLRAAGATKVVVAGHSQGGLFALYLGGRIPLDALVAIAPGGDVSSAFFREKVGAAVASARSMVSQGKGAETGAFADYEGSRGVTSVTARAADYLGWFDPDGAMNQGAAVRRIDPRVPVLFIVPTGDLPALLRAKQPMFDALPRNPRTRLFEPGASHQGAPTASREEIARWIREVAEVKSP